MGTLAITGNCNCSTSLGLIKLRCEPESRKTREVILLSQRLRMTLAVGVADGRNETGEAVLIVVTFVVIGVTTGLVTAG